MLEALGKQLQRGRDRRGASLQAVAIPAKISGAYLHKLEQGSVQTPSPRVLRRLATELDESYLRLMVLAGYLDDDLLSPRPESHIHAQPSADDALRPAERRAVEAFVELLIAKRDNDGAKEEDSYPL